MKSAVSPFQAIIFNLDGVLVDTAIHHYTAWKRLANSFDFDFSFEQHMELRGLSRMASLEKIMEWGGLYLTEAEKLHWSDVKNNWYLELIAGVGPENVLPGAIEFLHACRQAGLKLALYSSSKSARKVLELTGLESYFDVIVDGNQIRKTIPDPDCFLLTARTLEQPPASCIVFEDSLLGVKAARFGGFPVVGMGDPVYLTEADVVLPDFVGVNLEKLVLFLSETSTVSVSL